MHDNIDFSFVAHSNDTYIKLNKLDTSIITKYFAVGYLYSVKLKESENEYLRPLVYVSITTHYWSLRLKKD